MIESFTQYYLKQTGGNNKSKKTKKLGKKVSNLYKKCKKINKKCSLKNIIYKKIIK